MVRARPDNYATEPESVITKCVDPGLFTIGHSARTLDEFLEVVHQHDLRTILDVRSKPYSRRQPWFNRNAIRDALRRGGCDYFWLGAELGGLAPISIDSPAFIKRMEQVAEMAKVSRVALMCSEGHPKDCHRGMKLTAYLHRLDGWKDQIAHITADGSTFDSVWFEDTKPKAWLWVDFPGGEQS